MHLDDFGKVSPKVYNGLTGTVSESDAVVMHCAIPSDLYAEISISNVFEQGNGDTISYGEIGYQLLNQTLVSVKLTKM